MAIQLTKCTPLAIPKEWQEIAAVWTKHTNERTKIADKGSHTMLEPKADQVSPKIASIVDQEIDIKTYSKRSLSGILYDSRHYSS